jgi:two-component system, NtrC family, sensor kinase
VTDLVRVQKNFTHVELCLPPTDSLPTVGIAADDLTVVMINLLLNGAQAMQGKGQIRIECDIVASTPSDAANLSIHVMDTGPGIPPDIADRIFDPFFTNRIAGGGSGLGLAICMSICERNNARIELCSQSDSMIDSTTNDSTTGAHFKLTVPIVSDFPPGNHNML